MPLAIMATQTAAMIRPMIIFAIVNSSFLGMPAADGVCRLPQTCVGYLAAALTALTSRRSSYLFLRASR